MAIIYVNASVDTGAAGYVENGASWTNAYADLQAAIGAARAGDQIWVAAGIYTPGTERTDTFTIDKNIEIYGGFAGTPDTEDDLSQQNFVNHETILSGELGTSASNDNNHHVVTVSDNIITGAVTVRLDGFIIEDGSTEGVTGNDENDDGAGIYNQSGNTLILANAIVRDNIAADDGGGIRNSGTLTILNSTISGNTAIGTSDTSGGGGLINTTNGVLTIVSSTFSNNTSQKNGGGIRNDGTLTMIGSTISGNTANESGGGLVNTRDRDALFEPSKYANATITASTITNNTSINSSGSGGGGGISNFGNVTLSNSIVAANIGDDDLKATFALLGGAVNLDGNFTSGGHNLIGNGDGISAFANGSNGDQVGTTNNPLDPMLDSLTAAAGELTATHALLPGSTAIDAGNTANLPTDDFDLDGDTNTSESLPLDQRGSTRVQDNPNNINGSAVVDIGAFELQECFLAGTLIRTEAGEKPVENLVIGDRVYTLSGQLEPVKWIGQQTYRRQAAHPLRSNPIHIKPGALADNIPQRDLFVSPDHALLVDGLLINAGALTNGMSIDQIQPDVETFTYYHVELHHHALLFAEGTAAESYLPQKQDRNAFDNGAEYTDLYPTQTILSLLPMNYPRVSSKRQLPRFVAKRLEKRARSPKLLGLKPRPSRAAFEIK